MRLRTKLTLAFTAAAAPALIASAAAFTAVTDALEAEYRARLDAAAAVALAELSRTEAELRRAATELAQSPEMADLIRSWRRGDLSALVPAAGTLLRALGLDALEVIDAQGRVLSSGHLPGRFGDTDSDARELLRARPGEALLMWLDLSQGGAFGRQPALVVAQRLGADTDAPGVVAGRALGQAWLEQVAAASSARVELTGPGGDVLASAGVPENAGPGSAFLRGSPLLRSIPFPAPSAWPGASLTLTISGDALARAKARILRATGFTVVMALIAGTLLAGLLARRVTRPVEALEQGARAIARGDLDARVDVQATGEVGALVDAFNAMGADLRHATARATAAERVAAWREMAKRLAHEIKNPLTPISMSIETLQSAYASKHPKLEEIFRESTRAILEEVASLRRIVVEFSEFARLPEPAPAPCDAAELAQGALALHGAAPGVEVTRDFAPGLTVEADRELVLRALTNLVKNAVEAMGGTGKITMRTLALSEREAAIEIEDSGPGVAAENREKIFSASFTSKSDGSGLGLAIARRIAEEHGGRLELLSEPGAGALFRVTLPRSISGTS